MPKVLPLKQAAPPLHSTGLFDYFRELFRPDLGDQRVGGERRIEAAGFVPNTAGSGWSITFDPTFLHEKFKYDEVRGRPLYRSKPNLKKVLGEGYLNANDFRDIPVALEGFCEAHGFNYDMIADYRANQARFIKSEAWTDANAAHINQFDAMSGIIITIMTEDPEYFLTPRMDVKAEGDTTDSTPILSLKPLWTAGSSAAALLHMSNASAGTITSALPETQLIPRLVWEIEPDKLAILLANQHGNDPMSAIMQMILIKIAQNYGGNYYYGTLDTPTMVPDGLLRYMSIAANKVAIGGANAALDATTLPKLDEAIDAVQAFANENFLIFLNRKQNRALHKINSAQRVWETLPGLNMFGKRPSFYNGIPLINTSNLGQAENIDGTTLTGSTGASLWGVHMGGDGVVQLALAGHGGLRIDIEKVVGQDRMSVMGIDYASQALFHPGSCFRMFGAT